MRNTLVIVIGAMCCLCLCAGQAVAQADVQAREHFQRGKQYYEQASYDQALREFQAAAQLRPSPVLDYNMARCYERLGRNEAAITAYESYLAATPEAVNRDEVLARIAKLRQAGQAANEPEPSSPASAPASQPAKPEATSPASAPAAAEPPHEATLPLATAPSTRAQTAPPPPPPPRRPEEGPFYKQWWFWVGCAGGAVILGFIIATAVHSDNGSDEAVHAAPAGLRLAF